MWRTVSSTLFGLMSLNPLFQILAPPVTSEQRYFGFLSLIAHHHGPTMIGHVEWRLALRYRMKLDGFGEFGLLKFTMNALGSRSLPCESFK